MSRRDSFLVAPLFVLFMSHGLMYYIFPEQHYATSDGNGGWLSYIKYLCIFAALPALVRYRFNFRIEIWLIIGFALLVTPLGLQLFWLNESNLLLAQFQMATLGYFFGPYLLRFFADSQRARSYLFAALVASFLATTGEIMLGGIFNEFSRSGFRSAGPFINPNNTGIVVALIATIYHYETKGISKNLIAALLSLAILAIVGSKTAMAIYAIGALVILPTSWRLATLAIIPLGLTFSAEIINELWSTLELRELSIESGEIRSTDVVALSNLLSDTSLPGLLFGISNQSLIDNSYLDILTFGGLLLLTLFLTIQIASIAICVRHKLWLTLLIHGLLFLTMLTTNIPRLWPTGYVYWALISTSILTALKTNQSFAKHSIPKMSQEA